MTRLGIAFLMALTLATPLAAVQPDEVLPDPILEARARDISAGLRCPVCRNESIDESNATLARDLRLLLRERLVAGDTDAQAVGFIVARYGEYVLLTPVMGGSNILLWLAAPALLLAALGVGWSTIRRPGPPPEVLSDAEKVRLAALLDD